jgi:DNA-binding transcriptional MerR regulator
MEKLLDTPQLAEALGQGERTIRTWQRKRIIPVIVCGHRTHRYRLSDVQRALEKRTLKEIGDRRNDRHATAFTRRTGGL